jgi:cyclophilin family peptidyl-prolyl cis-trans isomerase
MDMMRRLGLLGMMVLLWALVLPLTAQDAAQTPTEICEAAPTDEPSTRTYTQAEQVLEAGVDYRAVLCTSVGAIYVDLYENFAPATVNNFVFLAQNNFYNNTTFHRVLQDFMAQGGDPEGTGAGGPGYQFKDEFVGFLHFDQPGLLAMANANRPEEGIVGTNGSQFFITTVPTAHLDYRHTIFGEVLEGQETVTSIELRDPQAATTPGTALNAVVIITDPAAVNTTYVTPEPATQEQVEAAFGTISSALAELISPDMFTIDEAASITRSAEEVVAAVDEAVRADYMDFLSRHNFQYQVTNTVNNASCDNQQLPFHSMSYTLMSFATPEDAAAALADESLKQIILAQGFTEGAPLENLGGATVYTKTASSCDTDAPVGRIYVQRGHFIAVVETTISPDLGVGPDVILEQVVALIYERFLSSILRTEL